MTFDSFDFALFLPIVFLGYWALTHHRKWQNLLILAGSHLFYGWWDSSFLALIIISTITSYECGRMIESCKSVTRKRMWNITNIVINLTILGFFKYFNFFADSLTAACSTAGIQLSIPTLRIILPVGISFYTFQALSYTIDVCKGSTKAEHNLIDYAAYLSFFPQLVAGPIERAEHLLPQFKQPRRFNYATAIDGSRRMLWGFFKKIAVADSCATTVSLIFDNYETADSLTLVYGALLFTFQIYADFSGYSDIAIGCAALFGIKLNDNFRYPYFATSIPDFWRRWHISLTSWFRDYVYIPLGGSRCSKIRTTLNTLTVFGLSGLWHGASWHFVLWGLYHGILFIPRIMRGKQEKQENSNILMNLTNLVMTFTLVSIGWILFRSENIDAALAYLSRMFTAGVRGIPPYSKSMIIPIGIMLITEWRNRACMHGLQYVSRNAAIRIAMYYLLFTISLWYSGQSTQFIYFQF